MVDPRQLEMDLSAPDREHSSPKVPSIVSRVAACELALALLIGLELDNEIADPDRVRLLSARAMVTRTPDGDM